MLSNQQLPVNVSCLFSVDLSETKLFALILSKLCHLKPFRKKKISKRISCWLHPKILYFFLSSSLQLIKPGCIFTQQRKVEFFLGEEFNKMIFFSGCQMFCDVHQVFYLLVFLRWMLTSLCMMEKIAISKNQPRKHASMMLSNGGEYSSRGAKVKMMSLLKWSWIGNYLLLLYLA